MPKLDKKIEVRQENKTGHCPPALSQVLVLGVGNILMGDDSVGVKVVSELERRYVFPEGVELLDGGTSGLELLSSIREVDCLIIVDAVKSGLEPGGLMRAEGKDVPAVFMVKISPHQLGISDLLAAATLSGDLPEKVVLLGVQPKTVAPGLSLTKEVQAGFEGLLDSVVSELEAMGKGPIGPAEEKQRNKVFFWE